LVENGVVAAEGTIGPQPGSCETIEADGLWLMPGLTDMHVHLREPGGGESETIASGLRAAVAGGFTTVAAMPNTLPPADTPGRIRDLVEKGRMAGTARLLPVGCITEGRAGGRIADIEGMAVAGAVAFSDDGSPVLDEGILKEAMAAAGRTGTVVVQHAELPWLEPGGVVNRGPVSESLGIPGIPAESETGAVESTVRVAESCGGRVHLTHLSLPESVGIVHEARLRGARVTCDVTPHHLALDETEVLTSGSMAKMNPPLRSGRDRGRLVDLVARGWVTAVASDHAPHAAELKAKGLMDAPFGITGLETALSVTLSVLTGGPEPMPVLDVLALFTTGPCGALGIPCPSLPPGAPFNAVLFDPDETWTPSRRTMFSGSTNTPFLGRPLRGRVKAVWTGRRIFRDGAFES
ncbi:MAG: hypothetical protein AO395_01795, partial [Candidatus Fermentibacter daniensis]